MHLLRGWVQPRWRISLSLTNVRRARSDSNAIPLRGIPNLSLSMQSHMIRILRDRIMQPHAPNLTLQEFLKSMHGVSSYHWVQCLVLLAVIELSRAKQTRKTRASQSRGTKIQTRDFQFNFLPYFLPPPSSTTGRIQARLHPVALVSFKVYTTACNTHQ